MARKSAQRKRRTSIVYLNLELVAGAEVLAERGLRDARVRRRVEQERGDVHRTRVRVRVHRARDEALLDHRAHARLRALLLVPAPAPVLLAVRLRLNCAQRIVRVCHISRLISSTCNMHSTVGARARLGLGLLLGLLVGAEVVEAIEAPLQRCQTEHT